jgi:V8-like Glu-specific endopeptidase
VGPNHVLTASHVVNWSVPGGVNGVVEVHRAGATVSAISAITRVFAFTRVTGSIGWTELDEDYAVLETADAIGDRFGWLGTRRYSSGWDGDPYWYNLGYPGDVGNSRWPTWQRGKWLDEHAWDFGSARAMDTNADINPGNSGGPMFAWWDEGPYVVAVVSAHDPDDQENYCAGGSDIVRLVRTARGL